MAAGEQEEKGKTVRKVRKTVTASVVAFLNLSVDRFIIMWFNIGVVKTGKQSIHSHLRRFVGSGCGLRIRYRCYLRYFYILGKHLSVIYKWMLKLHPLFLFWR